MPDDHESTWLHNLAVAILAQAVRDAKHGYTTRAEQAQAWLANTGSVWLDALGYDGESICQAIEKRRPDCFRFEMACSRGRKPAEKGVQEHPGRPRTGASGAIGENIPLD